MSSAVALLARSGLPGHEAERLLRAVTGANRAAIVGGLLVDPEQLNRFYVLVERRLAGEPLQYLEGTVQFGPIELEVDPRVLIPRPETEQLWERATELLPEGPCTVVDLGTGSGCLALAIKKRRSDVSVVATDISSDALDVARGNAGRLDLHVDFRLGDRLGALDTSRRGAVTMIVTNPPYVSESEWSDLPSDVRDHEPRLALVSGDGLDMFRYLACEAGSWLTPTGMLVSEIGEHQGEEIKRLFDENGWKSDISCDLAGRDRFLIARKAP